MKTETERTNWPPKSTPSGIEMSEEWNGFKRGDPIRLIGDRTGKYIFQFHTRYPNGSEGVVVRGGVKQHILSREVGVDRIERRPGDDEDPGEKPETPAEPPSASPDDGPTVQDYEARRKALSLSRRELAERAGVTESAIHSLERGKRPRNADEVRSAVESILGGTYPGHGIVVEDTGPIPIPAEWNTDDEEDD